MELGKRDIQQRLAVMTSRKTCEVLTSPKRMHRLGTKEGNQRGNWLT